MQGAKRLVIKNITAVRTVKLLTALFLLIPRFLQAQADKPNSAASVTMVSVLKHVNAPVFKNKQYNILAAGAVADGKTSIKPVLDSLITVCSNSGGGRVVLPKGDYYIGGPVVLKSHVNLHLDEGATLTFSSDPNDYMPVVLSKWEGTELFNYSPFVYAYECTDIAVTGKGLLNGAAAKSFATWRPQGSAPQNQLRQMGGDGTPVYKRVFGEGSHLPPSMIQFIGCKNVLIDGVSIRDAPYWVIHPVYCNNVTVRHVTINSLNLNNDGCDPESCSNVLIENCDFTVGDDAVAIKAGRDNDAWRIGQPTENVVVRNCTFTSKTNALCIGSEMSGGVRGVYMENINIHYCYSAIYFKSNQDRGGYIEDIHVQNINCDSARSACIRFENNYHGSRGGHNPTLFRKFSIDHVYCRRSGEVGIYVVGIEGKEITDVSIQKVQIESTSKPQLLQHVKNVIYNDVTINGKDVHPRFTTGPVKLETD
jgi:polygalacturonase